MRETNGGGETVVITAQRSPQSSQSLPRGQSRAEKYSLPGPPIHSQMSQDTLFTACPVLCEPGPPSSQ